MRLLKIRHDGVYIDGYRFQNVGGSTWTLGYEYMVGRLDGWIKVFKSVGIKVLRWVVGHRHLSWDPLTMDREQVKSIVLEVAQKLWDNGIMSVLVMSTHEFRTDIATMQGYPASSNVVFDTSTTAYTWYRDFIRDIYDAVMDVEGVIAIEGANEPPPVKEGYDSTYGKTIYYYSFWRQLTSDLGSVRLARIPLFPGFYIVTNMQFAIATEYYAHSRGWHSIHLYASKHFCITKPCIGRDGYEELADKIYDFVVHDRLTKHVTFIGEFGVSSDGGWNLDGTKTGSPYDGIGSLSDPDFWRVVEDVVMDTEVDILCPHGILSYYSREWVWDVAGKAIKRMNKRLDDKNDTYKLFRK